MWLNKALALSKFIFKLLKTPSARQKALKDPRRILKRITVQKEFLYRQVDQKGFLTNLVGQPAEADLPLVLSELKQKSILQSHLDRCLDLIKGKNIGAMHYAEAEILYILVRLLKPGVIVETGVASGLSSTFILQALEDNQKGALYSIDLPPTGGKNFTFDCSYYLPKGEQSGWIIPDYLRHRWHLTLGKSSETLLPLLKGLGKVDIFLHDSEHTPENMLWEYRIAWPFINQSGLLLSHDINEAFAEFSKTLGLSFVIYERIGGIKKP